MKSGPIRLSPALVASRPLHCSFGSPLRLDALRVRSTRLRRLALSPAIGCAYEDGSDRAGRHTRPPTVDRTSPEKGAAKPRSEPAPPQDTLSIERPHVLLFHGTDVESSELGYRGTAGRGGRDTAKHAEGELGFYLASDEGVAEFFAVRLGPGRVVTYDVSDEALRLWFTRRGSCRFRSAEIPRPTSLATSCTYL